MILQLNPPLPVRITDRGTGLAHILIDYGPEHDLLWVTVLDQTGEIWAAPNPSVRGLPNWSLSADRNLPPII